MRTQALSGQALTDALAEAFYAVDRAHASDRDKLVKSGIKHVAAGLAQAISRAVASACDEYLRNT